MSGVWPMGDAALLVEVAPGARHSVAAALVAAVESGRLFEVDDIVPGEESVLVRFVPGHDLEAAAAAVREIADKAGSRDQTAPDGGPPVVVQVRYDGPDLDDVAALTGLTRADVVARHSDAEYTVAFMGFSPGFAYLDGLSPELRVPRLATPRARVEAGSVAIAGSRCCVYPRATPGGWRVIGHTDLVLFDPDARPPAVFAAGARVRFVEAVA